MQPTDLTPPATDESLDESELEAVAGGVITTGSTGRSGNSGGTSYNVPMASGGGGTSQTSSSQQPAEDLAKVPSAFGPIPIPYPNL